MTLTEAVEKYRSLAGEFGRPIALADFGLSRSETERFFGLLDDDYHISRFFHFSLDSGSAPAARRPSGTAYQINSFPQSHVSIDPEIASIL